MKKTTFNISFDEDKASALVLYLSQKLLATLKDLNGILDEYEPTVEFENGLFNEIVESITVDSSEQLTFNLIGGIALTEQIPKKGR